MINNIKTQSQIAIKTPTMSMEPIVYDPKRILVSGELHPLLSQKVESLLIEARAEGLDVFLFEGHRSFERQDELYNQTPKVTNAKAGQSYHNFGLAADVIFHDESQQPSWNAEHDWERLGDIGKKHGLIWGGSFGDKPHFVLSKNLPVNDVYDIFKNEGKDVLWQKVVNYEV
jgi:peptidoglycan LD-endopeptidase CwlK